MIDGFGDLKKLFLITHATHFLNEGINEESFLKPLSVTSGGRMDIWSRTEVISGSCYCNLFPDTPTSSL